MISENCDFTMLQINLDNFIKTSFNLVLCNHGMIIVTIGAGMYITQFLVAHKLRVLYKKTSLQLPHFTSDLLAGNMKSIFIILIAVAAGE